MVRTRATVRDLRRQNRSVLLTALFLDGPLSRQQLSAATGLSAATASTITGELLDEGLLVEAGSVESDGGRPRVLLRVNPAFGHVIGVDVGETGIKVELFDLAMTRLSTVDRLLAVVEPVSVSAVIASGVAEVLSAAGVAASSVLGVGVGVPGTVERGTSAVVHAQTIGWDAVPLEDMIRAAGVEPPLFVENGAKTQGQAEMWFGAGRGARHAVIALVGSGVGIAVVTDGAVHRGATSNAGEWGHTTIVYGGRRCRCGVRGCLEAYAGADAMLGRYREALRRKDSPLDQQTALEELLSSRSAVARRVVEESVGYLGAGLANLVNLFNPERVVLGGWAGLALGARKLDEIVAATAEHALRHPFGQVRIELGRTGPDAVAVGAATLPVAMLLEAGADVRPVREIV
ncbi:ROK family protein [Lentzea sp. NPDC092896]|uniref:ROK family transcriptional regulator n=1 Tax=Lentzea sp. NPDC092896 TaxID=3364127 RepID=UPI00380701F1